MEKPNSVKGDERPAKWADFSFRLALFAVSAAVCAFTVLCVLALVKQSYRFRLRKETIRLRFKKAVLFRDDVERAIKDALRSVGTIDLAKNGLAELIRKVERCGWVKRVVWAEALGLRLRIGVSLRQPFAALIRGSRLFLCDKNAQTIASRVSFRDVARSGLVVVDAGGVRRWEKAAMRICDIVYKNKAVFDAYGVRITMVKASAGGRFSLVSSDGRLFEWGYAPGGPGVDYLSVKEKLGNLRLVLRNPEARRCKRVVLWSTPVGRVSDGHGLGQRRRQ